MRTVASSSLGFAACLSKNPDFSQSSELPLFTKGLRFYPKLRYKPDIRKKKAVFFSDKTGEAFRVQIFEKTWRLSEKKM